MNSVIELYGLMNTNYGLASSFIKLDFDKYESNEEMVIASFGLFENIVNKTRKLEQIVLFKNNYLFNFYKEIIHINELILNNYKLINKYMLYDFYKMEYNKLLSNLKDMLESALL